MKHHTRIVALSFLLLAACNTSGSDAGVDVPGPGEDTGFGFETLTELPGAEDVVPPEDTLLPQDTPPPEDLPGLEDTPPAEDTPPSLDVPEDIGPAENLAPCMENEDCESLLCGWHFGDRICLPLMTEICGQDFTAKPVVLESSAPDVVTFCVSLYSHLCLPCWSDADCQDDLTSNHACVRLGDIGGFCATVSDTPGADPVCPEATILSHTLKLVGDDPAGPHGGIVSGCVPPTGICQCTQTAADMGLDTYCFTGSDEEGWCMGERLCTVDGLAACTAAPPSEEVCDGLDNDCDGETDEGLCDDGDDCTQDACSGEAGCVFTPLTGTPCDDMDLCTDLDQCLDGLCVGEPWESPDPGPCQQVSCDPATGIQFSFVEGPCDDEDPCTTGDHCLQGECVGDTDAPPPPDDPCLTWACDGVGGWYTVPIPAEACDDANTCTTDSCQTMVGCVHAPIADCCGNGQTEGDEDCDDGNQVSGDGCDAACDLENLSATFVGYQGFYLDVCSQTTEETDAAMDLACKDAYGAGVRAADTQELITGIAGLPGSNTSGGWAMFKCPFCEGEVNFWNCSGVQTTCRKGLPNISPWPTSLDAGWNTHMCNSDRIAVCVQ